MFAGEDEVRGAERFPYDPGGLKPVRYVKGASLCPRVSLSSSASNNDSRRLPVRPKEGA